MNTMDLDLELEVDDNFESIVKKITSNLRVTNPEVISFHNDRIWMGCCLFKKQEFNIDVLEGAIGNRSYCLVSVKCLELPEGTPKMIEDMTKKIKDFNQKVTKIFDPTGEHVTDTIIGDEANNDTEDERVPF